MGSARDSTPDPKRARDATRQPWPPRVPPRPRSGIAPATPPRPPAGGLLRGDPKGAPRIPVPPNVRPPGQQPKLLDRLREALCSRHYSPRTEQTYRHWVKRFIFFHNVRHPAEMAEPEINAFLTGDRWLMASLMCGAGLRLMECLRLRVQDIDSSRHEILVRDGKGAKDRITMLPASLTIPLQEHLQQVKAVHERDVAEGWGRVQMPMTLDRKYPNAPKDWRWQWVFPQDHRWINPTTKEQGRHHVDASLVQKAVRDAVTRGALTKRPTCHTFRHSFATHLLEGVYDIRCRDKPLDRQWTGRMQLKTKGGEGVFVRISHGVLYGQEPGPPHLMRIGLILVGADASRRANGAASSHPLAVPALRAWPTSGCSGRPAPRARARARPPLSRGPVRQT